MVAYLKKFTPAVTRFVLLHLVLTLFSLPFLIAWGLPVSLLSPVGNCICSPIITVFLFFSSLFFFTELLRIPNGIIIWLLEQTTAIWLYILSWNNYSWLIGFSRPPLIILFFIFFCAFGITFNKWLGSPLRSIIALSALLCLSWISLAFIYPCHDIQHIPCSRQKNLVLLNYHNQTILIDPGYLQHQSNSWINYTLPSEIIMRTGIAHIDHLIILQPSDKVFQAIQTCALQLPIKKMYIPSSDAIHRMSKPLQHRCTSILFIDKHPIQIPNILTIKLDNPKKISPSAMYRTAHAVITIDTSQTTIYAAKNKKNKNKDFHE